MANVAKTNKKVIALALGAVTETAYLTAGADKGIDAEMQGKDNGDTIYYKITQLGDPTCEDVSGNGSADSSLSDTAKAIKQATVPVTIKDSHLMLSLKAVERQITSIGEDASDAKIGAKLGKKAVKAVIANDVKSIGNVFVANENAPFASFQSATSFLKASVEGALYGFMDWQVWGDLTGKGQQAVPCALAKPEFGKGLQGSWALIDQLRTVNDFDTFTAPATIAPSGVTASVSTAGVIKLTGGSSGTIKAGDLITIAGVYAKDVNDNPTNKLFVFRVKTDISVGTTEGSDISASLENFAYGTSGETEKAQGWFVPTTAITAGAVKSVLTAGKSYGLALIRAEGAQAFGSMKTCDCEGAKYSKSQLDGITVHANGGDNIGDFKTEKRWDMLFASKLVEPRAAALVLYPLD